MEVYHRGVVANAIAALEEWWTAVERRQKADNASLSLLRTALATLSTVAAKISQSGTGWTTIVATARAVRIDLELRAERHQRVHTF